MIRIEQHASESRLRRLAEELAEASFAFTGSSEMQHLVLTELDAALRPPVHERRIPSFGAIVAPTVAPDRWDQPTELTIVRRRVDDLPITAARRFADGLSSWLVRGLDGKGPLAVFDRPAGSERDLVVLAQSTGGTMVQRHPMGVVRAVGSFGVLRWDGIRWHHEPPVSAWINSLTVCAEHGDREVVGRLLEFAVHDLGARGIGALLVYRPSDDPPVPAFFELRLPTPPPLEMGRPADLAPLRHVLAQVDGAAMFDATGTLRQLGVRLIPSIRSRTDVEGFRGMRHTSARRYSSDEPLTTVIVVSEDGPVTVWRKGELLGRTERLEAVAVAGAVRSVGAATDES